MSKRQERTKTVNAKAMIDYAVKHGRITTSEAEEITGLSRQSVHSYLSAMNKEGQLRRIAPGTYEATGVPTPNGKNYAPRSYTPRSTRIRRSLQITQQLQEIVSQAFPNGISPDDYDSFIPWYEITREIVNGKG